MSNQETLTSDINLKSRDDLEIGSEIEIIDYDNNSQVVDYDPPRQIIVRDVEILYENKTEPADLDQLARDMQELSHRCGLERELIDLSRSIVHGQNIVSDDVVRQRRLDKYKTQILYILIYNTIVLLETMLIIVCIPLFPVYNKDDAVAFFVSCFLIFGIIYSNIVNESYKGIISNAIDFTKKIIKYTSEFSVFTFLATTAIQIAILIIYVLKVENDVYVRTYIRIIYCVNIFLNFIMFISIWLCCY